MSKSSRLSPGLTGIAGEYFVGAELSRRGYVASITLRNTRGIDILASNADATKSVGIQVKTNQKAGKKWILNAKVEKGAATNLVFVFVRLNGHNGAPKYHIVPRADVAKYVVLRIIRSGWVSRVVKGKRTKITRYGILPDVDEKYLDRLGDLLGLD